MFPYFSSIGNFNPQSSKSVFITIYLRMHIASDWTAKYIFSVVDYILASLIYNFLIYMKKITIKVILTITLFLGESGIFMSLSVD